MTTLRIVCTNDFLSSLSPMPTSYGRLPGGHALRRTVDRLRDGQPTIWADAGDFSNGGPLSTTSDAALSFRAAAELGIEVATLGNHEFDLGFAQLEQELAAERFPVVCANVDAGVPAATLLETEAGPVGFIGLTHPQVAAFTPHAPAADVDLASIVADHAQMLRRSGAIAVVVLFHFGVDWSVAPDGTHLPDATPVLELTGAWRDSVDAVVLGHTLGRWAGLIDGIPHVQPWAFGAEVGVIDLDLGSGRHRVELVTVEAEEARAWTGAGGAAIAQAESAVVGLIAEPLTIGFGGDISLADFAAEALREATGATAAVVPVVGMHQPAIAGVMYRWPAGAVTEADLSRFWPWTDDRTLIAEVTAAELDAVASFVAPEPWLAWGTSAEPPMPRIRHTIAVPRDYVDWATVQIGELVGRELAWRPLDVRLRDAVRTRLIAVSEGQELPVVPVAQAG
ncbi:MAG TPA: metallophosphoesterase [Conexibacter sp.]|nr:metallophosphoesterase [Conexibacter sp.]